MPERLTLSDGTEVTLGRLIGSGGEGIVHEVTSRSGIAIKVYHEAHRTADRAAKLDAMMASPPENIQTGEHLAIAWPIEQVIDADGRVAGFTMPYVGDAQELSTILNPSSRARVAPEMTWQHLLTIAGNIAAVVDALHSAGYVVGDLSERNFLVTSASRVTLIDCDSIQVPSPGGKTFISPVGTARFTAPELLGIDFESEPRTVEGDRFALAVLIFLIVSEGFHPFQGVPKDDSFVGDDITAIRLGAYAYSSAQSILGPPPAAPSVDALPPVLAQFFEKTFVRGHRDPSQRVIPGAWRSTLDSVSRSLQVCRKEPRHAFWSLDQHCPWCARADRIGIDTWVLASAVAAATKPVATRPVSSRSIATRSRTTATPKRGGGTRLPPPPRSSTGSAAPLLSGGARALFAAVIAGVVLIAVIAIAASGTSSSSGPSGGSAGTSSSSGPYLSATEPRGSSAPTAASSRATPRPTTAPTATSASGARWIANTGGVGVRARSDCRESSSGTSPGIPENTRVDLYQRGVDRCSGWSRVRASAGGQTRTVWVNNGYLSSSEPTPVPTVAATRVPTRVPTTSPTRTPTPAGVGVPSGTKPEVTALCNSGYEEVVELAVCRSRQSAGLRWSGENLTYWGLFDTASTIAKALDGKVVDWQNLPPLSAGWHMIQIYDPPGGVYEGWSPPLSFLVIE